MHVSLKTVLGGLAVAALLPLATPALAADYSARLGVAPANHSGACPHKFTFTGVIRARRAGRVQYRFIRSDGANAPVRTLNFDRPGAKRVSTTWTLGGPGMEYQGWQAIEITYPQRMRSNRAPFSLKCAGRGRPPARGRPDLIVRDLRLNDRCQLLVTIANVGDAGVPDSAYDGRRGAAIQMYRGSRPWGGLRLSGVDPSGKLKTPGSSVTHVWFPGATNLRLGRGVHPMRAVVDNNNAVAESNEGNNERTERLRCGGRPARPGGPGGGTTRPGGDRPRTHTTGPLVIPQTYLADLDQGKVTQDGADIWFEADTATSRFVTPRNGARLAIAGRRSVNRDGCRRLRLGTRRINIRNLPVGTYVCVRTNEGRISQFRVNDRVGPSPGTLRIGYTTWKKAGD